MNKIDYNKAMLEIIKSNGWQKKKILLHSCCAPCSTACIDRLIDYFDITIFYYNPNIDTLDEFNLRATEQVRYSKSLGIDCIVADYDKQSFLSQVNGLEKEREGGVRCEKCFNLRLEKTALKCKELGYDYFATTLTVSPLKNAKLINEIGFNLEKSLGAKYLPSDFKKQNGYLNSIRLSKENNLYRQNYCGCEFSKIKQQEEGRL
ncbi:MAG: epoxyqueuosine reductase QueH [Clostridiales bacterium]|nr:epoxyqueuosine reductase QueH [Clostridiales bacterium]